MILKTIGTAFLWIVVTAFLSTYANMNFFKSYPGNTYILSHCVARFAGAVLCGLIAGYGFGLKDFMMTGPELMKAIPELSIIPLFMVFMNSTTSLALATSGVTMTYVVKSTIPLWTVAYMIKYEGTQFVWYVYPALALCCVGVALACAADLEVSLIGFIAAFAGTISQTGFNIISAKKMSGKSPTKSFFASMFVAYCFVQTVYLPASMFGDSEPLFIQAAFGNTELAFLLFLVALSYYLEYQLNFLYLVMVNSLNFSITDIVRRLAAIGANSYMFNKELSPMNKLGILLALGGALAYSCVVSKHPPTKKKQNVRVSEIELVPLKKKTEDNESCVSTEASPSIRKKDNKINEMDNSQINKNNLKRRNVNKVEKTK